MNSIAFNSNGTKLAVGVSYGWEEGAEGAKSADRPRIFIKTVGEEVKVSAFFISQILNTQSYFVA